ncbi:Endo-1,4-beta-xylanase A precursor [Bhargavaea cecembensis DSE10]|uniref:Endo-1,4-beta-xylanase A n=1 Tax=Bhargavaea cecembensis DSE10 TaxID=1235279 RepID=M7NH45_9BACL|nr:S-layer homology domain-containing protein [Bhargavaea cecembensis]EMR06516.1 Endo-1,4-beta-xylanase A precursor [Bhargavaea cecembensis DSE10]
MKSKTYKRATALAAASALVGSVVIPVAAAPAETPEKFSDVPTSSSHYETILEARALGIMTGYGDSTFKPDQKLNRGNVAKAFGKYVVAKSGLTLEEYVEANNISEVENFTDVPNDWVDEELVTYSKIVKEAGIFKGANNKLGASRLMPRDQIAEVLVRAFGFENQEGDPGISDTDQSGYAKSIETIYENGISNANPYRPLESTSRGQFASFLVRAYKVAEGLDPQSPYPFPVESVHDVEDLTISVGETPELPETVGVTLESGVTTTKAVEWNTNDLATDEIGTYTITGDVADTDLTASVQVVVKKPTYSFPVTYGPHPYEVNTIVVDTEALTGSALDFSNYKFNGGPLPSGTTIKIGEKANLFITLASDQEVTEDFEYILEIQNVKTVSGRYLIEKLVIGEDGEVEPVNIKIPGTFAENVPPTLVSADYVVTSEAAEITNTIQLTFSEDAMLIPQDWDDDITFKVGDTEVNHESVYYDGDGKIYIEIPTMDINQTSTITIVPEGENNERLGITDVSLGRNPVVAPATKTITKDDVVVIGTAEELAEAE